MRLCNRFVCVSLVRRHGRRVLHLRVRPRDELGVARGPRRLSGERSAHDELGRRRRRRVVGRLAHRHVDLGVSRRGQGAQLRVLRPLRPSTSRTPRGRRRGSSRPSRCRTPSPRARSPSRTPSRRPSSAAPRTTTPRSATGSRRFRRPTRRTRTQMSTCRRSRTRRTSLRPERPARGLRDQQVKKPNTNLMCRPAQVGSARCLCLRDTRDVSRPLMAWIVRHDRAMMNMLAC